MRIVLIAIVSCVILAGCSGKEVWAPDETVTKAAYRHDGPPRLTLFTMINRKNGNGGHSSLMVNGSQRVIFDPAGSFKHPSIPERNDLVFGITPAVEDVYTRYHARETWYVKIQELDVSPQVAEQVMQLASNYGAVPSAYCARSTSTILSQIFPDRVSTTWYPKQLAAAFAQVPGVREQDFYEDDSDDNSKVLKEWNPGAVAQVALAE